MIQNKNTDGMVAYVRKRHDDLISKTKTVLSELDKKTETYDFKKVAELSGVSIAWLYRQPQLKIKIQEAIKKNNPSFSKEQLLKDRIKELEKINIRFCINIK